MLLRTINKFYRILVRTFRKFIKYKNKYDCLIEKKSKKKKKEIIKLKITEVLVQLFH